MFLAATSAACRRKRFVHSFTRRLRGNVRLPEGGDHPQNAAYRVSKAGERQGLDRDELHVNLGCLRKCAQVAGI
jgi:hypothetical protein